MFLWDFVADKVMGQIVDWIYSKLLEFIGEFFGMMDQWEQICLTMTL